MGLLAAGFPVGALPLASRAIAPWKANTLTTPLSGADLAGDRDCLAVTQFGICLPTPLVRIDYIFYSEHCGSLDSRVLRDSGGSDHRQVVSVLSLLGE